jgi:hypothetical protein
MTYKVFASRHDIPEYIVGFFTAKTDEEARGNFNREYRQNKNYEWDCLILAEYRTVGMSYPPHDKKD